MIFEGERKILKERLLIITAGLVLGLFSVLLVLYGNPLNMGFCIACFLRDIAGGLGLHRAGVVQYLRPEIMGLILGAFIVSFSTREFKTTGGSSPVVRFVLGILVMVGALVFLGCPLRMILRLSGGDLNALVALPGYVFGVWVGVQFLKNGYTLGRTDVLPEVNGYVLPVIAVGLLLLLITTPVFIFTSTEGPGSMQAPLLFALTAGLIVGILAQRSRLCTMGSIRDIILFRDSHLLSGLLAVFAVALIGNIAFGLFDLGFVDQPVAHTDGIWNFLSMGLVGLAAVLAGGCPLRQLILTGEGNTDSGLTVLGMITGAGLVHNFGIAASPAGVTPTGQVAVIIGWLFLLLIGYFGLKNRQLV